MFVRFVAKNAVICLRQLWSIGEPVNAHTAEGEKTSQDT